MSTSVISQSKVHLHLWWIGRLIASGFSWAITETCCPLLGVPSAFLLPGFLMTLQMSSTILSVRILSLSGLSSHCSLMSNLAALGLNPSRVYISWNFKAIISGPCALCTHRIPLYCSQGIILLWRVPSWGISMFAYSASGSTSFHLEWMAKLWVLNPHSLHLDCSLLCLCLLWCLTGPLAEGLVQALLHLLVVAWMLGIPSLA